METSNQLVVQAITQEGVIYTFEDASKKPVLAPELADHNLRVVYKLERATASKDGTVKSKQHKAVAIEKQDWPAYFSVSLDAEQEEDPVLKANYLACHKAIQNAFDDIQDAAVHQAIADAIEAGAAMINGVAYTPESIVADLAAERTSNRLTKSAIVEWFAESAAPALVSALVAKGAADDKIATAVEAASALLGRLASINPALNDKQREQVKKLLQLDTVAQQPLAQQLLARVNNIKDDSAALDELL